MQNALFMHLDTFWACMCIGDHAGAAENTTPSPAGFMQMAGSALICRASLAVDI
jgi:hypothetical protein